MKRFGRVARVVAAAFGLAALVTTGQGAKASLSQELGGDALRAALARNAILELDVAAARAILKNVESSDPALSIERARLAIYEGDYDGAAAILSRPDLSATSEGAELGDIARGCARSMAGAIVLEDLERGVALRLQDDEDAALAPKLTEVAVLVRKMLIDELGVELPKPLRIDLVRDQFTLAAMTGLPEEAAQTTGTVAVAKWGRVTMLTPRAMSRGYPWLDTLAHEMTHLALSRGTRDKAPLWLQEGVAKRQETRWRSPEPLDDVPSIDSVAAIGIDKGLGRSLDQLGPSIAMLPTPEQASVAFAEVQSFVRFYAKELGPEALPQLVQRLKSAEGPDGLEKAIHDVSGADFGVWDKRWRASLVSAPRDLPQDLTPGSPFPHVREIGKRVRLGELLHERGHAKAAAIQHGRAHALAPFDAMIRANLADVLLAEDDRSGAAALVEKIEDVHGKYGRWWSLHGMLHPEDDAEQAFAIGISLDPLDPKVACEEKKAPEVPKDPIRAAICGAARRVPGN